MAVGGARVALIGDGGWGTTLAILLAGKGTPVGLWGPFAEYVALLQARRENVKFLPGIRIPDAVLCSSDLGQVLAGATHVLVAVPSRFVRVVAQRLAGLIPAGAIVISGSKGLEEASGRRLSEVLAAELHVERLAVISGPTIAPEVARGVPSSLVAASRDLSVAREVQALLMSPRFRVYTSADVVGVELGGALKNVIAIAAGISDGLGFGANTKAALLARGLAEMARLGVAMGGERDTFSGLSGLGDLATTCMSQESRNRGLGAALASGRSLEAVLTGTEQAVEGVWTTKAAVQLAARYEVEMPISQAVHAVLFEGLAPLAAVDGLMRRVQKDERE